MDLSENKEPLALNTLVNRSMLFWDILGTISHLQSPDKSLSFAWMLLQVVIEPGQAIFKVTHSDNSQEVCKLIQLRHV
jgi:hypothetical protein